MASISNLDDEARVRSDFLRSQIFPGASHMFLYRLLNDEGSGFPKPFKIGRINYWRLGDIRAWLAEKEAASNEAS